MHADEQEENSSPELPDTALYGFCNSTSNTESSDDASASENGSESGSPRSDGYLSAQNSFDKDKAISRVSLVDPNKPLYPNYAPLVNSVNKFSKLKTENNPVFVGIDPNHVSPSRTDTVRGIGGSYEVASASFHENNGNLFGPKGDVREDSVPSSTNGANNSNFSGSRSLLHFSFSLSGGTSKSNAQVAQVNENVADGSLPTTLGISRTTGSSLLSDNTVESVGVRNSPSSCEGFLDKDRVTKELSDHPIVNSMLSSSSCINSFPVVSKSESRSVRDSNTSMSMPLESGRSHPVFIQPGNTSNISKRSGNGSLVDDSSAHLPSIIGREPAPPTHPRKIGTIQVGTGVSSPDANFSSKSVYGFRPFAPNELKRSKSDRSYVANGSGNVGKYNNKVVYLFTIV